MDQHDLPEVSFRDARDIVSMLWHRGSRTGANALVRAEAVTMHDVGAPDGGSRRDMLAGADERRV